MVICKCIVSARFADANASSSASLAHHPSCRAGRSQPSNDVIRASIHAPLRAIASFATAAEGATWRIARAIAEPLRLPLKTCLSAKHLFFKECHPERQAPAAGSGKAALPRCKRRSEGPQRRSNLRCSSRGTSTNPLHAVEFRRVPHLPPRALCAAKVGWQCLPPLHAFALAVAVVFRSRLRSCRAWCPTSAVVSRCGSYL